MIDNSLLKAFSAVVREGSFEKAAQRLHLTPSAVSQKIKQLESRLGSILLVRSRPCRATENGYQVFRHAETIGLLEKDLLNSLPHLAEDRVDTPLILRIAVNADSVDTWFTTALVQFMERHHCLFDLILDDQNHTSSMLRKGNAIAAISADNRPVQGYKSIYIGSLRYIAVASPGFHHRYFSHAGITPETLQAAPCITFNRKDSLQHDWLVNTFHCDFNSPSHWVPSSQGYLRASLDGLGWGLNSELVLSPYLADGSLIELLPNSDLEAALYWQYSSISGVLMQELTQLIQQVGRSMLLQSDHL